MTPIAHGRAPGALLPWAATTRLTRGLLRLAAFVAAWWALLAIVARS